MKPRFLAIPRLWRTLRPLKREQVVGRLMHEVRQRAFKRVPSLLPLLIGTPDAPAVAAVLTERVQDVEQLARAETAERHGRGRLAGHDVGLRDWDSPDLPKLVRYHLHYLDTARDLAEAATVTHRHAFVDAALALVRDWSTTHPLQGSEAWEPYPASARLLNLSVITAILGSRAPDWLRRAAAMHARYAGAFPEVHLQGNHLLKNWSALAAAGLCFDGPEPAAWEVAGLAGLRRELAQQLLPDGGHVERSVMYHCLILSDLLDVRDFARARGRELPWLEAALAEMIRFLSVVLHPDGEIPLFNDAVLGHAPHPAKLFARFGRAPEMSPARVQGTPQFGLTVLRPSAAELVLFDTGELGPVYQPGHAHSDTLSYELSVEGERRAVNGGVDGYQSQNRAFFRSAVAHNTVTVDGEGPDELWGTFRVGGRGQILFREEEDRGDLLWARASVEAFQAWRQTRTLALFPGKALVVLDEVEAHREVVAVSRARLVPGRIPLRFVPLLGESAERSTAYAPEFGKVFDITEHSVQGRGSMVRLAYALAWHAQEVRLEKGDGGFAVTIDGRRTSL